MNCDNNTCKNCPNYDEVTRKCKNQEAEVIKFHKYEANQAGYDKFKTDVLAIIDRQQEFLGRTTLLAVSVAALAISSVINSEFPEIEDSLRKIMNILFNSVYAKEEKENE